MSWKFYRRALLPSLSLSLALAATPGFAGEPQLALASARAMPAAAAVALPDAVRTVGPIAGPIPRSLLGFANGPVRYVRAIEVASATAAETPESRRQLDHLRDHRNLYRGPGSLVHLVGHVRPVAAPEQAGRAEAAPQPSALAL